MYRQVLTLIVVVFLFNISLLWVSVAQGLDRPYFNLDYMLLGLCGLVAKPIIQKTILFILLLVFYSFDILLLVLQIFPFVHFTDLIYLSSFVFNGPIFYRLLVLATVVYFLFSFILLKNIFSKKIKLSITTTLVVSIITIILGILQYSVSYNNALHTYIGSQTLFFLKNHQSSFIVQQGQATFLQASRYSAATQNLWTSIENNSPISKKVLLVVNESWGATQKAEHQNAILAGLYQRQNQLEFLKQGNLDFVGATVAGELRELCQKAPPSLNLKDITPEQFVNCLPQRLKKLGYRTHALHAASSRLYERDYWYPAAGFMHTSFAQNFSKARQCNSFSGRCDVDLIPYIKDALLAAPQTFVYWLTLNTHAPYNDQLLIKGLNCQVLGIKDDTETCLNYKLQYQFFTALADLIDDPAMKGVEIYVVGDHSPPIFDLGHNLFSFKGTNVAWVHFQIK